MFALIGLHISSVSSERKEISNSDKILQEKDTTTPEISVEMEG